MGKVERIIIYTLLAVLTVAAFTNLGPTQAKDKPGEATFRKLTIVDEEGRARIELGTFADGSSGIGLYDENQKRRMGLGVASDGSPVISLNDQNEMMRVGLVVLNGSPHLLLWDQKGKTRVGLGLYPDGSSGLELSDQNGKLRAVLGSTVLVRTKTGTEIKRSPASLVFFDKEGKVTWKAPLTD